MNEETRKATPAVDYRPFLIADADTGHGGDAHVRNLIRRFVEVGVPDTTLKTRSLERRRRSPGGQGAGRRGRADPALNAARLQLDIMRVPGIIVARTDAEAATFLDNRSDERGQPFILGATNLDLPSYRIGYLAILRKLFELGADVRGHLLFAVSEGEYRSTYAWLRKVGLMSLLEESARTLNHASATDLDHEIEKLSSRYVEVWQVEAGLKTYGQAIADVMKPRADEGERFDLSAEEWLEFAKRASFYEVRERARSMDIQVVWDCELPKTPEGFYQIQSGIDHAIARSRSVAPFADILWMETKTADLADARKFAEAIHAEYPDKMLAYNLSPPSTGTPRE